MSCDGCDDENNTEKEKQISMEWLWVSGTFSKSFIKRHEIEARSNHKASHMWGVSISIPSEDISVLAEELFQVSFKNASLKWLRVMTLIITNPIETQDLSRRWLHGRFLSPHAEKD